MSATLAMATVLAVGPAVLPGPDVSAAPAGAAPAAPAGPAASARSVAAGPAALAAAVKGTPVCQVRDARLTEISGMAATDTGYVVVNDGADQASHRRIFFLDRRCAVTRTVSYPSRPRDTEDLAIGPDGTIWVADIGDNGRTRQTVALWRLPVGAQRPVLHRMTYPDGPHDAEALLITGDGRPVIVTKRVGAAGLYAPTAPLRPGETTPLVKVGQVRLPTTRTSNPYSWPGRMTITGAATSPDGHRVVLRTYADAFEFDVPDGDVIKALTEGKPRITPLPDEPQGEAVTYSRDGRSLLTVSETARQPAGTRPTILVYRLAPSGPPATPPGSATATPGPAITPGSAPPSSAVPLGGAPGAEGARSAGERPDRDLTSIVVGILGLGLIVTLAVTVSHIRTSSRLRRTGKR